MNDIILNRIELKNILRFFGKDIIEGIEHKRRKEPLKDNLNCSNSELLEHIEETREKRRNTRIAISILHRAYEELKEKEKQIIKMRFKEREKIYYISKSINRGDTQTRVIYYKALDKMIDSYKIFDISRIDKSLYSDKYFDFII